MYTLKTVAIAKVPRHVTTEPAVQRLSEALRIKDEREISFNGDSQTHDKREEYLDSIKEELKVRSQGFKYQIYEMGKLLCEAKKILPHGKLQTWVNENFEFCYKTAFNFMKVYRVCMGHPEVVKYFNPSCLYVISRPDFPQDLREALFKDAKGPVDIKEKDLVQLALKYKNGELKITDKEVQDLLKKQRDTTHWENYKIELKAIKQLIANRLERIETLSTIHPVNPLIEKVTDEEQLIREEEEYKIISKIKDFIAEINVTIKELDEKCK